MTNNNHFVHESSYIDDGIQIGKGTSIWHFCDIFKGARIGKNCKIGQNVVVHSTASLGNNVKVQNNVSIYDGVILEDHIFCGPSCVFTNIFTPRAAFPGNSAEFYRKTLVKEGASLGANATIVCGVTIGCHAFVGAGSVVTRDVGDYELVYGNPARCRGWACACGEKLNFQAPKTTCTACQREYQKTDNQVTRL